MHLFNWVFCYVQETGYKSNHIGLKLYVPEKTG